MVRLRTSFDICHFFSCTISRISFFISDFRFVTFEKVNGFKLSFYENVFDHVCFKRSNFQEIDFYREHFMDCLFTNCSLCNAQFTGCFSTSSEYVDNSYEDFNMFNCKFNRKCNVVDEEVKKFAIFVGGEPPREE